MWAHEERADPAASANVGPAARHGTSLTFGKMHNVTITMLAVALIAGGGCVSTTTLGEEGDLSISASYCLLLPSSPIPNGEDVAWLHVEVVIANSSSRTITIPTCGTNSDPIFAISQEPKIEILYFIHDPISEKHLAPEVYRPITLRPGQQVILRSTNLMLASQPHEPVSVTYTVQAPIAKRNEWWSGRLKCTVAPMRFKPTPPIRDDENSG